MNLKNMNFPRQLEADGSVEKIREVLARGKQGFGRKTKCKYICNDNAFVIKFKS